MDYSDHRPTTGTERELNGGTSRRRFLRTAVGAAVAVGGLGSATSSSLADTDDVMEVDLRGGVPPVTAAPQGEDVVIFNIHGYTGSSRSVSNAETIRDQLRAAGNSETVAAITWDDSGFPGTAESNARDQGGVLADWLNQYLDENPETTIRILGFSMGSIVAFEMLSSANGRFTVANVDHAGSYEVSGAPCKGSEFHDAIDESAKFVGNYYSTGDSIARLGDGPADCSSGSLPQNYADVDMSDAYSSHGGHRGNAQFTQAWTSNFQPGVDRGDDGDDGDDGDGGDGDTTAPTAPSNLRSPWETRSRVRLYWDGSADSGGSGLDHYNVFVDGSVAKTVAAGRTRTTVRGLSRNTTYQFAVTAVDGAGNESDTSNTIAVETDYSWWG